MQHLERKKCGESAPGKEGDDSLHNDMLHTAMRHRQLAAQNSKHASQFGNREERCRFQIHLQSLSRNMESENKKKKNGRLVLEESLLIITRRKEHPPTLTHTHTKSKKPRDGHRTRHLCIRSAQ